MVSEDLLFVPGNWSTDIDVNDFVSLNKTSFRDKPEFLTKKTSSSIDSLKKGISSFYTEKFSEITLSYSLMEKEFLPFLKKDYSDKKNKIIKIGPSESYHQMAYYYRNDFKKNNLTLNKTSNEILDNTATSELRKLLNIEVFRYTPINFTPSFSFPDVRIIPLYGTRNLIKQKRSWVRELEKRLQTPELIEKRISLSNEIESLKRFEKFASRHGFNVKEGGRSTSEVVNKIIITMFGVWSENPSVPFSPVRLTSFLDIFINADFQSGSIDENEAQYEVDRLFLHLSLLRFSLSPGYFEHFYAKPFFLSETIDGQSPTKTCYRFIDSIRRLTFSPFHLKILGDSMSDNLINFLKEANLPDKLTLSFHQKENKAARSIDNLAIGSYGQRFYPGDEMIFSGGSVDLKKVLFLSLNGGKDIDTNTNIRPVSNRIDFSKKVSFEKVYEQFVDYFIYLNHEFIKQANHSMYTHEVYNQHAFRSSLMNHRNYIRLQLSYENLMPLLHWLSSFKEGNVEVEMNSNNYVVGLVSSSKQDIVDSLFFDFVETVKKETSKLSPYKNAKISYRFYYGTVEKSDPKQVDQLIQQYKNDNDILFERHRSNNTDISNTLLQNMFDKGFKDIFIRRPETSYIQHSLLIFPDHD